MFDWQSATAAVSVAAHELALFAAIGFLIGGIDDLLVDIFWVARAAWRRLFVYSRHERMTIDTLPPAEEPGWLAVFIPAWDEARVIQPMLRHALTSFGSGDYRIYVGCYPNDRETIAAAEAIAREDAHVRVVVNPLPGPTTKADCLNTIWRMLQADEAERGAAAKAVILHDAEDIVHSGELKVFDRLIERFELVQIPVMPLMDPRSRWIAGHYADEFAEHHGKSLVVREAIGAGVPLAGTGCAIRRDALQKMADAHAGLPFDPTSLTEDYEIGLRILEAGGRNVFVRLPAPGVAGTVAVRAYFPGTIKAAVRQKARWMTGIALAGWDRLGWRGGLPELWMRSRDRWMVLNAIVLTAAYLALVLWSFVFVVWWLTGYFYRQPSELLETLLLINLALLIWRLVWRFAFVTRIYGLFEGLLSIPRAVVANIIAMMSARRAFGLYWSSRKGDTMIWEKTSHDFPASVPAE